VKIIVTGAAGSVGRRVSELLPLAVDDAEVLALDRRAFPLSTDALGVDAKVVDLARADLDDLLRGGDVLVHLASGIRPEAGSPRDGMAELEVTRSLFDAAARVGVRHLVVLSSAMVYGARPGNPVPLTEDAPPDPNPGCVFAGHRAELERLAEAWRAGGPGRRVTVFRPAVTVAEGKPGGLARVLRSAARIRSDAGDAPAQFLHAVDLASAVVLGVVEGVDGVLNVAPDGWIAADVLAALAGPAPRPRLPDWMTRGLAWARWRSGLSRTPPGMHPYTVHPWVVANDRVRALGWVPSHSNEEAYVAGHAAGRFDMLNAKRRQQLALGAAGGVGAAVLAAVGLGATSLRRRRRRS
jgi:nucleoside-diphosphate-sugar epimerase